MGGGGKNKSKQQSQSQSETFGYGQTQQAPWQPQADALASLYQQAQGLPGINQGLVGQGQSFIGGLNPIAEGSSPMMQQLAQRASGQNPFLQSQIDQLGSDLGSFYREQINPALTSGGIQAGGLGGARQGIAQGMAADQVGDQFRQGASQLRFQDVAQQQMAANQFLQNQQGAAQLGMGGLGQLSGMQMSPYALMGQLMGVGPTVLTDAWNMNEGSSSSTGSGSSSGWNFGIAPGR